MKLNRISVFQGSETSQLLSSNNFTNRHGTNLVLIVRWDDATTGRALNAPELSGYYLIRIVVPTQAERAAFVVTPPTRDQYDSNHAVFTWDGRRVGSVYFGINDNASSVGNFTFRINIDNQDSAISNFRMTELAYEYTS